MPRGAFASLDITTNFVEAAHHQTKLLPKQWNRSFKRCRPKLLLVTTEMQPSMRRCELQLDRADCPSSGIYPNDTSQTADEILGMFPSIKEHSYTIQGS
ncbi:hypothetical protein N7519_005094 [Penicillium mononematosum]|uniref:uncharacterized protein n=1 Tax=Penicillium mononematosum TaxID=268346 RepID=UPI0025468CF1|nr:uncharacterized protein N7519_005094 [Penicillium mononematosum]KAJ6183793.1 hypothetical protein N7519_005094 [Penicillium mononematosum]